MFIATGASLFPGRLPALDRNCGSTACCTRQPSWHRERCADRLIAVGDPAQLFSPDQHEALWRVQAELDFPGTVYGVPRGTPMRTIMARQAEFYGAHRDDQIIDP